jgi:hypothetical protein
MLDEQTKGCALSKGDSLCCQKEYIFPIPSFWDILFFCLFQFFKELEKE